MRTIEGISLLTGKPVKIYDPKNLLPPDEAPAEGYKWVQNLLTHKWVQIPIDTPLCCDPSSETFHSM